MIRTPVFVALGAVLGFAAMFSLVSRRPPQPIPPNWISFPGTPVAVNDTPVGSWDEANRLLQGLAARHYCLEESEPHATPRPSEFGAGEYKITYVRRGGGRLSDGPAPETVMVRAWMPITVEYARASPMQMTRFEVVRGSSVE